MRESMGFTEGMLFGMSRMGSPRGNMRQLDWTRAKELINERKEKGLVSVEAGLAGDWSYTAGEVWRDGKYVKQSDTYTYTSSNWATPTMIFSFADGSEEEVEVFMGGEDADGYFDLTGEEVW